MIDIRDIMLNSQCITSDNYDFVENGNLYLPLLKVYDRVFVTNNVCFSGMYATTNDEIFFNDAKVTPKWWKNSSGYEFSFLLVEKDSKIVPVDLTIQTHNLKNEMMIKFNLFAIKQHLATNPNKTKDHIINLFFSNLLVYENEEFVPYNGNYALNLINEKDGIEYFAGLVLSATVPVLLAVSYLDKELTEAFHTFLTEFLGMFLESPLKN